MTATSESHRDRSGRRREEEGFALVMALLTLVGLTLLATAGHLLSAADYRISQSHRAATHAFYLADAGLESYLGSGRLWPDTVTYTHPEGVSRVWATKVVDVDLEASLYRITARGRHQPPEGGVAQRTVNTIVILKAAPFDLNAAYTAPPGLRQTGVTGVVSGYDAATALDCGLPSLPPLEDVAGLAVPPDGLEAAGDILGTGDPVGFLGEPPIDESQEAMEMLASTGIDWAALRSDGYREADFVHSEDGYPDFEVDVLSDEWPMVVIDAEEFTVGPPMSGRGTLVVHGNLTIDGAFLWRGIILVGGKVKSNGENVVSGALVSGLNMLLGQTVGQNELGLGSWEYVYNSCNVRSALKGMGSPVEEPGTWSESI